MTTFSREELLNVNNFKTETGRKLFTMLKGIWDNGDFLIGIMATVKGDEKRQELINELEKGITDTDEIYLLADKISGENILQ